jgi:hypothetical protein
MPPPPATWRLVAPKTWRVVAPKTYLGDGAYAEITDGVITLTAENGYRTTNRIVLEPAVWQALICYAAQRPLDHLTEPEESPC